MPGWRFHQMILHNAGALVDQGDCHGRQERQPEAALLQPQQQSEHAERQWAQIGAVALAGADHRIRPANRIRPVKGKDQPTGQVGLKARRRRHVEHESGGADQGHQGDLEGERRSG